MADTRKTPDAREGARAINEERWEESARAERRLDELAREGIAPREAGHAPHTAYGEEGIAPELHKSLEEQDEIINEQSRVGQVANDDERSRS
jgi:hypothetical protein